MDGVTPVLVPPNEEGTRATVLKWCKSVGDAVAKDEPLIELETDKVTVEVPAPVDGTLVEILKQVNDEVHPEEVLAHIRLAGDRGHAAPPPPAHDDADGRADADAVANADAGAGANESREDDDKDARLSPAVRRLLRERGLRPGDIRGTGRAGRITAEDVERHVIARAGTAGAHTIERVPHTAIRRRVAEHMARSLAEAPHVTTLFEADLSRVVAHRARHAEEYAARGARLTLTAYFVRACAQALVIHREVNATFHADALELHADVNIGIGTALGDKGLIVPVLRRTQDLSLLETARRLHELVAAARAGKLVPDDVRGGTFTISNHGVGGSLLAAPIVINQPQVAILGVGKVERRVCVIDAQGEEAIAIRSMCYLTLSLDHRALDAFQANAFLTRVVGILETWPQ
ncbi:MAG TPA: 2-oxo acid dehydrogenase subunit E2 [Steroidobacteraceae bacterium]|jgi:2-oxoglutarate dehydrogenase E2 component (dihydrolipoamide succinyltransferase)|nr:2-oxo acid dehydrogenase subunit E2 [Steroidobacteraceae bacterium]